MTFGKHALRRVHVEPEHARAMASDWSDRVRGRNLTHLPGAVLHEIARSLPKFSEPRRYSLPVEKVAELPNPEVLKRNDVASLFAFVPPKQRLTSLRHFLTDACTHFERAHAVFTRVKDGILTQCMWIVPGERDTVTVIDAIDRDDRDGADTFAGLSQVLHAAATIPGTRAVCVSVPRGSPHLIPLLERIGATPS
jgi:hypothetical protein